MSQYKTCNLTLQGVSSPAGDHNGIASLEALKVQSLMIRHLPWEGACQHKPDQLHETVSALALLANRLSKETQKESTEWLSAAEAVMQVNMPFSSCS